MLVTTGSSSAGLHPLSRSPYNFVDLRAVLPIQLDPLALLAEVLHWSPAAPVRLANLGKVRASKRSSFRHLPKVISFF
jgi:hypothetical protein